MLLCELVLLGKLGGNVKFHDMRCWGSKGPGGDPGYGGNRDRGQRPHEEGHVWGLQKDWGGDFRGQGGLCRPEKAPLTKFSLSRP